MKYVPHHDLGATRRAMRRAQEIQAAQARETLLALGCVIGMLATAITLTYMVF